jgi:predicted Zn finger-like uncharacterized protein
VKFLCPQCKAKYQISDDKVAGKSVRMKCRKCAFLIELRASVAEAVAADEQTLAMGPAEASAFRANALRGSVPPGPGTPVRTGSPAPVGVAPHRPSAMPSRPLAPPSNSLKPPPRSTLVAGALVTGAGTNSGGAASSGGSTGPLNVQYATKSASPGGALASAFARNFDAPATDVDQTGRHVEWYCAIGGAPVGPLSAAELQQKVASGSAEASSLVWRDGLEEWQPRVRQRKPAR